jgi:hypothetical protein
LQVAVDLSCDWFAAMASSEPPNIRLRKAAEARIAGIQQIQAEMQKISVYSKFEESSNRIQRQRMATHKLQAAKNALEEDLNRRRKQCVNAMLLYCLSLVASM